MIAYIYIYIQLTLSTIVFNTHLLHTFTTKHGNEDVYEHKGEHPEGVCRET
jgi:hypothetical protein